jgi:hypothetical protein
MGNTSSASYIREPEAEEFPQPSSEITVSVFWCGTAGTIFPHATQVGMFSRMSTATEISKGYGDIECLPEKIPVECKISFDGCGSTNGAAGVLFGQGLVQQCDEVVLKVKALLKAGYRVKLNCLGLSRGAVAILMLAKKLAQYPPTHVELNCCLFDPVPGNLITSSSWDLLNQTLARQCMDVSSSKNMANVLAIYTYKPIPDFAFHAPLLPKYPPQAKVEEIVGLGCHQAAMYFPTNDAACLLSFAIIREFLSSHGSSFDYGKLGLDFDVEKELLEQLEAELVRDKVPTTRFTHSYTHTVIERASASDKFKYLNSYHYKLKLKRGLIVEETFDESSCLLRIVRL